MSLSSILNNLAVESGAVMEDQEANPEELTIVTDSTLTELDDVIAEMAEDVEKAAQGNDAAEKMIDVIESLESKVIMLRSMRDRGDNLNEMSAHQYANSVVVALESRGFPAALYQKDIADLKVSFESHSRYDYSVEAEDKTVSLGAKIKGMFARALDAFIQFWRSLVSRVKGLTKSLGDLGHALIKRSKGIDNNASTDRKIKINGLYAIASSKTAVDPMAALEAVKAACKDVTKMESDTAAAIGRVNVEQITTETVLKASVPMPKIGLYANQAIVFNVEGQKFAIDGDKLNVQGDVAALSSVEIANVGTKMVEVAALLTVSENDQKQLIAKIESGLDSIVKMLGEKDSKLTGPNLKAFNQNLSMVRSGRVLLNQFAATAGKQAYRFASLSANAY